jgi:hypothetical protein
MLTRGLAMKPLSRQLTLPFRAPPAAAPRALPRPAAVWRGIALPHRATPPAPDLSALEVRAVHSTETPA